MKMPLRNRTINADKVGWRVNEWADDTGLGRAFVYEMINDGRIKSVKIGSARVITTSPREFLENYNEGNDV